VQDFPALSGAAVGVGRHAGSVAEDPGDHGSVDE